MIPRITRDDTEHDSLYCKSEDVEQLELENAELKRQLDDANKALQDYNTLPCYDVAFDRGAMAAKQKYSVGIEELKAKLAESKANHRALAESSIRIHAEQEAKLSEWKTLSVCAVCAENPCLVHSFLPVAEYVRNKEARIAEYERQIKDGELLTVRTIIEWILWEWDKLSDEAELQKSIQEYAVRRQKEGGV